MSDLPDPLELVKGSSTLGLLRLYAAILTELLNRKVVRSRNAPAGDLAEHLAAAVYGGTLARPSAKSWDLTAADGRLVQVKCRVVNPGKAGNYSFFRSWDFDACVFVQLEPDTYSVTSAVEVPAAGIQALARPNAHVNGARIHLQHDLLALEGSVDRTSAFQQALQAMG